VYADGRVDFFSKPRKLSHRIKVKFFRPGCVLTVLRYDIV